MAPAPEDDLATVRVPQMGVSADRSVSPKQKPAASQSTNPAAYDELRVLFSQFRKNLDEQRSLGERLSRSMLVLRSGLPIELAQDLIIKSDPLASDSEARIAGYWTFSARGEDARLELDLSLPRNRLSSIIRIGDACYVSDIASPEQLKDFLKAVLGDHAYHSFVRRDRFETLVGDELPNLRKMQIAENSPGYVLSAGRGLFAAEAGAKAANKFQNPLVHSNSSSVPKQSAELAIRIAFARNSQLDARLSRLQNSQATFAVFVVDDLWKAFAALNNLNYALPQNLKEISETNDAFTISSVSKADGAPQKTRHVTFIKAGSVKDPVKLTKVINHQLHMIEYNQFRRSDTPTTFEKLVEYARRESDRSKSTPGKSNAPIESSDYKGPPLLRR